ncbi:hypothetical protein IR083_03510 [Dysgonomonas sp. GY75]|uniref:hypothetical protein n=1 Tax=Dysgonomonas sp. GY75 TaxID=2780419 RepID=UPI00188385B1|nr:hypothetical protein [Dysgonomonas sp. GY75]MBF0647885.1 hypothetical protein [Dysgonomonas sp. GY75]
MKAEKNKDRLRAVITAAMLFLTKNTVSNAQVYPVKAGIVTVEDRSADRGLARTR